MISLNDYLYSGDTVLKILHNYARDLERESEKSGNGVDQVHADFLSGMANLLEHNDFLTSQSQRIREFYRLMANRYPCLAFTFRGRIKSLIRAEEKFNGYVVEDASEVYDREHRFPEPEEIQRFVERFRDLIAYRIVISMPRCHIKPGEDQEQVELSYLYEIANMLPPFMRERGFEPEASGLSQKNHSPLLDEDLWPFYRDYITNGRASGYRSLHITFYDTMSQSYLEMQLRTQDMDNFAEIGEANHTFYEMQQNEERARRAPVPVGICTYFDEAYERGILLQQLDFSKVDVNMFKAFDQYRINDGCGLLRGRLILPYEHLSRFQNDLID